MEKSVGSIAGVTKNWNNKNLVEEMASAASSDRPPLEQEGKQSIWAWMQVDVVPARARIFFWLSLFFQWGKKQAGRENNIRNSGGLRKKEVSRRDE